VPNARVTAFGSRANGRSTSRSDLDLAVDNGAPLSLDESARINSDFSESRLPYFVDVVDLRSAQPEFCETIERSSVPLEPV
jgi:predicted nucleotidyltransferase